MSLTLPRPVAGLALIPVLAAGCGTAVGGYHTAPKPAAAPRHHPGRIAPGRWWRHPAGRTA